MARQEGNSGGGSTAACPECSTKHAAQRGNCEPLAKRRGPPVYLAGGQPNPQHPAHNGTFDRLMSSLRPSSQMNR
jgi:Cu/Zn superoxide dismutase